MKQLIASMFELGFVFEPCFDGEWHRFEKDGEEGAAFFKGLILNLTEPVQIAAFGAFKDKEIFFLNSSDEESEKFPLNEVDLIAAAFKNLRTEAQLFAEKERKIREEFDGLLDAAETLDPENHITSEKTGFHTVHSSSNGKVTKRPDYMGLRKAFEREHPYVVMVGQGAGAGKGLCYVYQNNNYIPFYDGLLDNFAQSRFRDPFCDNQMASEFRFLVLRTNPVAPDWFSQTTEGKINFRNGVLDFHKNTLLKHSPEYGFRYILSFNYDPRATSPVFDKFLQQITCDDLGLQKILLEYMGYALSGDYYWEHKALFLDGIGENGKSTFINVLKALLGKDNYSGVYANQLKSETTRQMLDGKLCNIAEETPAKAFLESSIFKDLTAGGEVQVRVLYKSPYNLKNKAKFIFACNKLPESFDTSHGFFRRFLIVPFNAKFSDEMGNRDAFIEEKLLTELPGIFNRALAAYKEMYKRRAFSHSQLSVDALQAYRRDIDYTRSWVESNVEVHKVGNGKDHYEVLLSDLYLNYRNAMSDSELEPLNQINFGKKLREIITDIDLRKIMSVKLNGKALKAVNFNKGDWI